MLIKSFEGFRPRAIQREDDGWVIGYGHTLSARQGATVSEADAELLLRYDLLPIEKSVNEAIPNDLNQHQFDALVSFGFSVGLDHFATSDVRHCLAAGATVAAADAMMGWPEPALPETALRRRAAERALFVADPAAPVALSDLLVAPILSPSPEIAAGEPESAMPEPLITPVSVDARGAAVAALLGEPSPRLVAPEQTGPEVTSIMDTPVEPAEMASDTPTEQDSIVLGTASIAATDVGLPNAARYAPYAAPMIGPLPGLVPFAEVETPVAAEAPATKTVETVVVDAPVEPLVIAPRAELVLTPTEDPVEPAIARPLWNTEEQPAPDAAEASLFGDDSAITRDGPILRHEAEQAAPARFEWRETGPFIFMGVVGLVSFGAAMAAFRRAAEQSGGNELSVIGWALALIGLACVGVSSINLYRRFGLPGGD